MVYWRNWLPNNPIGLSVLVAGLGVLNLQVAQAVTLTLEPADRVVEGGQLLPVNVVIAELGEFNAPSVAAFDLSVTYDPSILSFTSVVFGEQLDLGFGSIRGFDSSVPGQVTFFEISLVPEVLDLLQPSSFTLATLTFEALIPGSTPLIPTVTFLADTLGDPLPVDEVLGGTVTVIPWSPPILLHLLGLGTAAYTRNRRERSLTR